MSYPVLPCHVLSCPALFCPILPYYALYCCTQSTLGHVENNDLSALLGKDLLRRTENHGDTVSVIMVTLSVVMITVRMVVIMVTILVIMVVTVARGGGEGIFIQTPGIRSFICICMCGCLSVVCVCIIE